MSSHYSGCLVLTSLFAAVGTAANHLSIERRHRPSVGGELREARAVDANDIDVEGERSGDCARRRRDGRMGGRRRD